MVDEHTWPYSLCERVVGIAVYARKNSTLQRFELGSGHDPLSSKPFSTIESLSRVG